MFRVFIARRHLRVMITWNRVYSSLDQEFSRVFDMSATKASWARKCRQEPNNLDASVSWKSKL